MPRKLLKRWSPDPEKFRNTRGLRFLGGLLRDPNLFHLNRRSVSLAFFVGIFIAFLPMPGQLATAAVSAIALRCNLPLAVALTCISNPLTFPVIAVAAYKLGAWMLAVEPAPFAFELSWQWFSTTLPRFWRPLLLGCLTMGVVFGSLGALVMNLLWRWHVVKRWQQRRLLRTTARGPRL